MKKLIITCVLSTLISFESIAQTTEVKMQPTAMATQANTSPDPAPRQLNESELKASGKTAEKNTKELQAKLGLSKEQYDAVYQAEYRFQIQYDKYPANGVAVPQGLLSNITSQRMYNMKSILTQEQFEKFQSISSK